MRPSATPARASATGLLRLEREERAAGAAGPRGATSAARKTARIPCTSEDLRDLQRRDVGRRARRPRRAGASWRRGGGRGEEARARFRNGDGNASRRNAPFRSATHTMPTRSGSPAPKRRLLCEGRHVRGPAGGTLAKPAGAGAVRLAARPASGRPAARRGGRTGIPGPTRRRAPRGSRARAGVLDAFRDELGVDALARAPRASPRSRA